MDRHFGEIDSLAPGVLSPFSLASEISYQSWREAKLANYPRSIDEIRVPVADLALPEQVERTQIMHAMVRCNMAIYFCQPGLADERSPVLRRALAGFLAHFNLRSVEKHRSAEDDGFVAIEVSAAPQKRGFIPYSSRSLNWHTDGYYAPPETAIRAMLLHCVKSASAGGENALLDPEIAYIRLRDSNPKWIEALMHPRAMTIPASSEEDGSERPVSVGPVFAIDPTDGSLLMRYTARGRNIIWRDDADTREAIGFLEHLLVKGEEPLILKARLAPGEGLLCNNVLHTRTAFEEAAGTHRRLYRARFATRVTDVAVKGASGAQKLSDQIGTHS